MQLERRIVCSGSELLFCLCQLGLSANLQLIILNMLVAQLSLAMVMDLQELVLI